MSLPPLIMLEKKKPQRMPPPQRAPRPYVDPTVIIPPRDMTVIYPGNRRGKPARPARREKRERRDPRPSKRIGPPAKRPGLMFADKFAEGDWKGRRCFIIGGGPSLKTFDWGKLNGELVIGTNLAFQKCDPAILFSMDNRFLKNMRDKKYGEETLERFANYKYGYKVWLDSSQHAYPDDMLTIGCIGQHAWSDALADGIGSGGNSGFCAINIAVLLGASPIYLLGFDGKGNGQGRQAWWHKGHPDIQPERVYQKFDTELVQYAAPGARAAGAQIINLNADSSHTCFEFGRFEDIAPIERPVIVAYATEGTGYVTEAQELNDSLKKWGFERDIRIVPNLGSWQKNTQYKAHFLKDMLAKHAPKPIFYVDTDGRFRRYPELLCDMDRGINFACHWKKTDHSGKPCNPKLISSGIFFRNNGRAGKLIDDWIAENERNPTTWDQKTLDAVIDRNAPDILGLPPEYCAIFDAHMTAEPVIEQMQASRRLKREVNRK